MTERPTYPKSTCCIPGCPRWSRRFKPGDEWVCGRHWRMMPMRCRRALRRTWAKLRAIWDANPGRWDHDTVAAYHHASRLAPKTPWAAWVDAKGPAARVGTSERRSRLRPGAALLAATFAHLAGDTA